MGVAKVLFIEWSILPEDLRDVVSRHHAFGNDRCVSPYSEWSGCWHELSKKSIEEYWKDQTERNNFQGTLGDFIEDYGLHFEVWLLEQDVDLTSFDMILISISW